MLTAQEPPRIERQIECDKIRTFYNLQEAELYAKLKGLEVYPEQGKEMWNVMPRVNGFYVGGCPAEN